MASVGEHSTGAPGRGAATNTTTPFAMHVLRGRWFMLFASVLIMAASGGANVFGVYSKAIRTSLGYDQKTLNTLSTFKNVGAALGILPGLLNEVAPPWVVLLSGAGMNLVGYLMTYLAISRKISPPPSVPVMCLYVAAGAASQSFATTSAVVSTVTNFPDADRGGVLGLLTGFGGLSGAVLTQLHRFFFASGAGTGNGNNGGTLVLLIACVPSAVSLLAAPVVRRIPHKAARSPSRERRAVDRFLYVSIVLGVYLLAASIVELKVPRFPKPAYYATAIVLVLLLVFLPLAIVLHQEATSPPTAPISTAAAHDDEEPVVAGGSISSGGGVFRPPARGDDHTVLQALFTLDMQLIFLTTICGISGLLTALDNIGQIGESLGHSPATISMLVSLANISNYAGRVVAGFGSEHAVKRHRIPRPLALTAVLLLACAGHALVATGARNGLYAAALVAGFCLGAQWPVLFAVVSEVFGLRHFSTLYNLVPLATPLGCYALNVQLAGRLYDGAARRQTGSAMGTCVGARCFRASFMVIAAVTVVGVVSSLLLAWRTRKFYRGDIYRRFVGSGDRAAAADTAAGNDDTAVDSSSSCSSSFFSAVDCMV